jgi:hypothetical protein
LIQPLLAYIGPGAGIAQLRSQLASAKQRLLDLDDDARRDYAMPAWIR